VRHAPSILSRRQLFLLAGAAARLAASQQGAPPADSWNSKPRAEWSTGDIYRLMNHSPWANPVQSWSQAPSRGGATTAGSSWPPSPQLGPKGVVTWESAQPIRDALKTALPRAFANCYVIGVDGIPLGNVGYLDFLRGSTFLRCKGKAKWTVRAWVVRELVRNSAVCAFGFPRASAPINADTDEIHFATQFGRWMVQTRFKPKDMLYHGKLAL
jgi:hypothetical protein